MEIETFHIDTGFEEQALKNLLEDEDVEIIAVTESKPLLIRVFFKKKMTENNGKESQNE